MRESSPRRHRMVMELHRCGINDHRVLAAMERIPRELFVPEPFLDQAYENTALPIGLAQTVSQPLVVAAMTEALEVGDRHKVLEIGTGSGYQAAILSRICRRVYTIERHKPLLKEAEQRIKQLHIYNITSICGDGNRGWPEQAPFDRILVTAAATEIPPVLLDQLSDEGVMVIPVGNQGAEQVIVRVRKVGGRPMAENLFPVRFVPLVSGLATA